MGRPHFFLEKGRGKKGERFPPESEDVKIGSNSSGGGKEEGDGLYTLLRMDP